MHAKIFFSLLATAALFGYAVSTHDSVHPVPNGIDWDTDYKKALEIAAQEKKPALLYFWASWCQWCKKMDTEVLPDPDVTKAVSENFVPVIINRDARENAELLRRYDFRGTPTFVVVDAEGRILFSRDGRTMGYYVGYMGKGEFIGFLRGFTGMH